MCLPAARTRSRSNALGINTSASLILCLPKVRPGVALQTRRKESSRGHQSIRRLAADIPELWSPASTTDTERKEIVRQVIERVVVEVEGDSERVGVHIEWAGGLQPS
jgi:hypothetical protein